MLSLTGWDIALYSGSVCILIWLWYRTTETSKINWIKPDGRFILITGCDTGFGHALAKRLDERGCNVFATCLLEHGDGAQELRRTGSARMRVIALDVSSDESVEACQRRVKETVGETGLWAVVNNAGINVLGDVEFCTMTMYKRVAEVNLFGVVRTCKAFISLLRESKGDVEFCTMTMYKRVTEVNLFGVVRTYKAFISLLRETKGRFVNVTSIKGLISDYHATPYVISKYGAEAFSDGLRLEMKRFGVKVSLVEPGNFGISTGMMANSEQHKKNYDIQWAEASDEVKELYGKDYLTNKFEHTMSVTAKPSIDPVTDALEEALFNPDPKVRYVVSGGDGFFDKYAVLAALKPFLPYKVMDILVQRYL